MSGQGKFLGQSEIMARLKMPWRHVLNLVEYEGLPVTWIDGCPILAVADLAAWEAARAAQ